MRQKGIWKDIEAGAETDKGDTESRGTQYGRHRDTETVRDEERERQRQRSRAAGRSWLAVKVRGTVRTPPCAAGLEC